MDFRGHEWVLVGRTVIAATMCAATAIFGLGLLLGWWLL